MGFDKIFLFAGEYLNNNKVITATDLYKYIRDYPDITNWPTITEVTDCLDFTERVRWIDVYEQEENMEIKYIRAKGG
jgi:hypothetical protein